MTGALYGYASKSPCVHAAGKWPTPTWTKMSTQCGSQYDWNCCTVAGSSPDICPYAAYNTQDGDSEFGCHGSDYTVGYGMSVDECKDACAAQADRSTWGWTCAGARWDHRTARCMVIPYWSCWGEGAIQDGQSVSEIWRMSFPTPAPTPAPTSVPTKAPTAGPTKGPTAGPTASPSVSPSHSPSFAPTHAPSPTEVGTCTEGTASQNENTQKASLWLRGPDDAEGGRIVFGAVADINLYRQASPSPALRTDNAFVAAGAVTAAEFVTASGRRLGAQADAHAASIGALQDEVNDLQRRRRLEQEQEEQEDQEANRVIDELRARIEEQAAAIARLEAALKELQERM